MTSGDLNGAWQDFFSFWVWGGVGGFVGWGVEWRESLGFNKTIERKAAGTRNASRLGGWFADKVSKDNGAIS